MRELLALGILVFSGACLWLAWRLRRSTGIPWARVVADDTGGMPLAWPLFAPRYRLAGKPDYLIQRGRYQIPVEVKPGRRAASPYDSDLMQLAAYCLLVEETSGVAPPYGLLRYATATFRVHYTPVMRTRLLDLLDEMRAALPAADLPRDHTEPARCRHCGFREVCEDSLA